MICLSFCQTHFQVFLRWVKHCLKARHWSLNQTQSKWILIKKVKETTCAQTKEISSTGFVKITEILEIDGMLILDMEIFLKSGQKIEGPVILVLSEKLGQNHAQSVNLYFKLNSFCKGIGSYTNSPSLYRILLDLAQKSPCLQHRSPNPWILDLPVHFSQSSNMFSGYIMFSAQYFGSSGLKISKVDTLALKNIVYTEPFLIGNVF